MFFKLQSTAPLLIASSFDDLSTVQGRLINTRLIDYHAHPLAFIVAFCVWNHLCWQLSTFITHPPLNAILLIHRRFIPSFEFLLLQRRPALALYEFAIVNWVTSAMFPIDLCSSTPICSRQQETQLGGDAEWPRWGMKLAWNADF